jgi:hypothetical protein
MLVVANRILEGAFKGLAMLGEELRRGRGGHAV